MICTINDKNANWAILLHDHMGQRCLLHKSIYFLYIKQKNEGAYCGKSTDVLK